MSSNKKSDWSKPDNKQTGTDLRHKMQNKTHSGGWWPEKDKTTSSEKPPEKKSKSGSWFESDNRDLATAICEEFKRVHPSAYRKYEQYDYSTFSVVVESVAAEGNSSTINGMVAETVARLQHLEEARTRVSGILESWRCDSVEQLEQLVENLESRLARMREASSRPQQAAIAIAKKKKKLK
jgi:hypothetical protein